MAFAPFLRGVQGPIARPPSIGQPPMGGPQPILNGPGNHIMPQPPGIGGPAPVSPWGPQPIGGIQSPIQPQQPGIGAQQSNPGMQSPIQSQQRPIASYDNLKHVHTITKSGLYRLKKGEKVVPLSSLAKA